MNRIMVIDDSRVILEMAKRLIEDKLPSASVTAVSDARKALKLLVEEPYHVLILDIVMPNITGIDVLKVIRRNKKLDDMKVIMFTSLSDAQAMTESFQLGAYDFISKPLVEHEFVARISHAINEYNEASLIRNHFYELTEKNNELEALNTELKEAQAELIQTEKLAGIGHLAAGMAHEINNPLGFLRSNVETVHENLKSLMDMYEDVKKLANNPETKVADCIEKIEILEEQYDYDFIKEDYEEIKKDILHGFKRIEDITESLRKFSRIDSESSKEPIDVNEAIENILLLMVSRFEGRVKVLKDLEAKSSIQCNKADFNMSLMAILNNAFEAIEKKEQVKQGTIEIQAEENDQYINIRIKDDGVGMWPDVMRHAMDPFYTTKEVGDGVGLGLTTAYNCFVNRMKGSMKIDSDEGDGTTVTIRLPK